MLKRLNVGLVDAKKIVQTDLLMNISKMFRPRYEDKFLPRYHDVFRPRYEDVCRLRYEDMFRPTIADKNNEINDRYYQKVAFLMNTEMDNFRPQSLKAASKL